VYYIFGYENNKGDWLMRYTVEELREKLNELDLALLNILLHRMALIPLVANYKKTHNLPIFQPEREKYIFDSIENFTNKTGLDPNLPKNIFASIINASKEVEDICIKEEKVICEEKQSFLNDNKGLGVVFESSLGKLTEFNELMEGLKKNLSNNFKNTMLVELLSSLAERQLNEK
jgi:chorismate mutase